MNSVIVENVRCFHERQSAPLRPVTVLVGENSSGKTTFLGLVRLAWEIATLDWGQARDVDFNADPFAFGSYDQIATFRGGRGGLSRSFTIGAELKPVAKDLSAVIATASIEGAFVSQHGRPTLDRWTLQGGKYRVVLNPHDKALHIETPGGSADLPESGLLKWAALQAGILDHLGPRFGERTPTDLPRQELATLSRLIRALFAASGPEPFAFAPIRTKPQRTYDPITDEVRPEGSHVPVVLARMVGGDPDAWAALSKAIEEFGRVAGLFDIVDVRRMGRKDSDPFQIRVKLTGPAFNLVDVGYGVSQVLPILVDCSRDKRPRTFLLQQPEVHLHPRAQAALGSWLAALAKAQNKRFVIETHSDHLVDRLRMDVRDRKYLKPADVAILYFERRRGATHIRHLELDERGNFKAVPEGYRSFFLEEERRMLAG